MRTDNQTKCKWYSKITEEDQTTQPQHSQKGHKYINHCMMGGGGITCTEKSFYISTHFNGTSLLIPQFCSKQVHSMSMLEQCLVFPTHTRNN